MQGLLRPSPTNSRTRPFVTGSGSRHRVRSVVLHGSGRSKRLRSVTDTRGGFARAGRTGRRAAPPPRLTNRTVVPGYSSPALTPAGSTLFEPAAS